MTLKQLEVFLAVADTRSFSKGGELVSLAQSTASQHIRALEEELGARLFDRSATMVRLTEAGRLFYEHASNISRQCSAALEAVRRFQGLEQATLQIGASTMPAACLIPDLLGEFSSQYPGVRLEVTQGDTREVTTMLLNDQVELAVVGGRNELDQIRFFEIGTERIVLVVRPGRIAKPFVSTSELQKMPLIVRETGSGTRLAVETALTKAGVAPNSLQVVAQLGSSEAVRRAVLSGAGCAFVSTLSASRELADGLLQEVEVAGLAVIRSYYAAVRSGRTLSPAAQAFLRLLGVAEQ